LPIFHEPPYKEKTSREKEVRKPGRQTENTVAATRIQVKHNLDE
jgi:hypothetical protein